MRIVEIIFHFFLKKLFYILKLCLHLFSLTCNFMWQQNKFSVELYAYLLMNQTCYLPNFGYILIWFISVPMQDII